MEESILIRGARVHNLKNVSLAIPHNLLTVVTGVSGSGKSSLVFDTVYAEGQRRYVESLSSYARQFLERMEKPDVDEIAGIAPPIAIRQKNTTRNPRSTVATSTEIYDYLRLLYARAGRSYCPKCGDQVLRDTVDQVAQRMLQQPEGSRWYALFPVRGGATTEALRDHLFELRKKGFTRLYQNGQVFEFSTPESLLDIDFSQPVFILVDRFVISPELHQRIVDTTEICYRESGEVIFEEATPQNPPPATLRFSEKFACKRCGIELVTPEPSLFSFNNPMGACPRCQGFGNTIDYDMDLVIPNPGLSLDEGAVDPWTKPQYERYSAPFRKSSRGKVRWNVPYADLDSEEQALVVKAIHDFFAEVETKKYKVHVRVFLSRYRGYAECPNCGGSRLRADALNVKIAGRTIADLVKLNIEHAYEFFQSLELSPEESAIADKILVEIRQRLKFLNDVGLDYLTLDRLSSTLSGGEAQRIQLATCLGSRLVGACYVLDEPSIGLHSRDTGTADPDLRRAARSGQHHCRCRARRRRDARGRPHHRYGTRSGRTRRGDRVRGIVSQDRRRWRGFAHLPILARRPSRGQLRCAQVGRSQASSEVFRRSRPQSEGHRRRDSVGPDGCGDGRFRFGKIDAGA